MEEDRNINENTAEMPVNEEAPANETVTEETASVETEKNAETDQTAEEASSETAEESKEETDQEAAGDETINEEAPAEEEPPKGDLAKKIKIGIVAAGGVFVLLAAIYAASLMGGKNTAIDKEEPVIAVAVPTEEPEEKVTYAPVTKAVVEEEPPKESLLSVAQGNARYDDCIYADGGTVIVKKGDLYGAIDYEGKEIVPVKYSQIDELPTKEGMFVLSVSKSQSVTKEKDGTTYSYEEVTTTYTLFDNTGKKLYEGNDAVVASGNVYVLAKEDSENARKNRVEYYKLDKPGKAFLVLYVNDQFSLNGFRDGMTAVMGFTAEPTEDQDTNPTNLNCGTMDENGKITWFAKAPGMDKFDAQVAKWKEDNKVIRQTNKKKSTKKKVKEKKVDEDGNEIEDTDSDDENAEDADLEEDDETLEDEEDTEDTEETETTDSGAEADDEDSSVEEPDSSTGPVYHMNEILNAPNGGYFVYKDLFDVEDSYSWYTDKGTWYADLDTSFMKADAKKGFALGNFNNGAVEAKDYVYDGESYYNFGKYMVLKVGDKDVLIDITKGQGMTNETLSDKIVVAIYDEIFMTDADYWRYREGNKYGYLDLKGKPLKDTYDDATDFVNGYALVIKEGKARIINDKFEEVEEINAATDVESAGDIFTVTADKDVRRYILKTVRENPTGKKDDKKTQASGAEATVTPKADDKKKK